MDVVRRKLKRAYPDAACSLHWQTPLDLLIATILSAQCTDRRVNIVTKKLFSKYRTPQDYLSVPVVELENDIFSCGTYHAKARAIRESCATILQNFSGSVPRSMAEMLTLRGVGRKTAAIVLGTAYGMTEGIPVDTHVLRVSQRLGLTRWTTQQKIENDLMKKVPRSDWLNFAHWLVALGRDTCIARRPRCERCIFRDDCPSSLVVHPQVLSEKLSSRRATAERVRRGKRRSQPSSA